MYGVWHISWTFLGHLIMVIIYNLLIIIASIIILIKCTNNILEKLVYLIVIILGILNIGMYCINGHMLPINSNIESAQSILLVLGLFFSQRKEKTWEQ